jgi:hypothetical protein
MISSILYVWLMNRLGEMTHRILIYPSASVLLTCEQCSMSLGNVYHCAYDRSPWIISFGSSDPIGTTRGDLLKSVLLLYIFGHKTQCQGYWIPI